MQADDYPVESILSEGRRFMVPLYQRKYQWGDDRVLPFWEDVEAKAAEVITGANKFQHYMGALILAPLSGGPQIAVTPCVQIVDGQQRLTTFQLFLAALREVARDYSADEIIKQVNGYLYNQLRSKDIDPLTKYKLTPTPSDRGIFHRIIDSTYAEVRIEFSGLFYGARVPKNTQFRSLRAYYLFRNYIIEFVTSGPRDLDTGFDDVDDSESSAQTIPGDLASQRLEALLRALLEQMKLVVITLDEGDDAQVIFETLNSKGEPLLAMDLVRNNIFQRAEKQSREAEDIYNRLWGPFDEPWWKSDAPNARPKRPRIDHFLAHVLTAETGSAIAMRELYAEYRAFAIPKGVARFPDVEDELHLLRRHAPIYQALEEGAGSSPTMSWFGRKLAAWQVTTVYPIALQIASSPLPEEEKLIIVNLLYSYMVRRSICGLTSKNMNKIFVSIANIFHEGGVSLGALVNFFISRAGDSSRFPSNREFKQAFTAKPTYLITPGERIKDILWELEVASRSGFSEAIQRPDNLWIEHVLPISWNEKWPFPSDETFNSHDGTTKSDQRDMILHSIGNLTLMRDLLNISSSNSPFVEKREKYAKHTILYLNKWFSHKTKWDEYDIRERGDFLADIAIKRWPSLPKDTSEFTKIA